MDELKTTGAVIEALGGFQPVADLTKRGYTAVWNWSRAAHFPPDTYVVLTGALKAVGKSAPDSLWRMTEAAEPERAAS